MSEPSSAAANTCKERQALAGRRIALVHPAWHSCGTYRVVLGQIAAWRALGATVWPIAIGTDPGYVAGRDWIWRSFTRATPELDSGPRFYGGAPFCAMFAPRFVRDVLWPYLHGDQAVIRLGMAEWASLSREVATARFDLVHCNHFFLMPVARRLAKEKAPILLDTHDLQARQFALINERMPWLSPRVGYDRMLSQELEAMRGADLLLHLNAQEDADFRSLLPEKRHALLYPAVPEAPTGPGGGDIILVASNNTANVESVIWFLREIVPRAPNVQVEIVGSVADGVRSRAPDIYERCKSWFVGRVADPGAAYAHARLVLLPTIGGTGLSIKSAEALSSGLPIIATSEAMRGMPPEALSLNGVRIANGPEEFAVALNEAAARPAPGAAGRRVSAARRYYETQFSLPAYERRLAALAAPMMARLTEEDEQPMRV